MPGKNCIKYEDLLKGDEDSRKGFTPNLVDVKDKTFSQAVDELKAHVKSILKEIEEKRRPVEKFVIGKTFARKKPNKENPFKRMDFNTWHLDGGVNGKWNRTYKEDFDGLVVICAATKNVLQRGEKDDDDDEDLYNHHDFALALKQQLIHYFAYDDRDKRLGNSTLTSEDGENKKGKAAVLYVAFKLKGAEE